MGLFYGAPEGIRTPDLLVRSQTLYPAELQAQVQNNLITNKIKIKYFFKKTGCKLSTWSAPLKLSYETFS